MGRPSDYCEATVDIICTRLVEGETLRAICRDEAMPALSTVFRWLQAHAEFQERYAHARELQAEAWADDLIEIADDGRNDFVEREGGYKADAEHIQRSKLRVDARKWLMAKAAPKKYGEKVSHEHGGAPNGAPLKLELEFVRADGSPENPGAV